MQRSIPFLWALVIALLMTNVVLLYGVNRMRLTAIEILDTVDSTLGDLQHHVVAYDVKVNQSMPIVAKVPFNQTLEIPIDTVIPIDQELALPFQMGNSEVEINVPVKTDFPISMMVPVDFKETVIVETVVELSTTVPIDVDISKTSLAGYLVQARQDVNQLRSRLALQEKAAAIEKTLAGPPTVTMSAADNNLDLSQVAPIEVETAATPHIVKTQELAAPEGNDSTPQSNNTASPEPDLGLCAHTYWPLQLGTMWTYISPDELYTQRVDRVYDNQVYMNIWRGDQNIQFELVCYQEGLGGRHLVDARIITELENLKFSNPRGMFLPRPEILENIGGAWTQKYDVTGTIDAFQGNKPVVGNIIQGQAAIDYLSTGFETLETPLGPRKALRIEQELYIELNVEFDLNGESIPVTETLDLTIVYWFVEGIGPVKIHWQGGTVQYNAEIEEAVINKQFSVPALSGETIASVCVLLENDSSECMQAEGISASDLAVKPMSRLKIQKLVFPDKINGAENPDAIDAVASVETDVESSDLTAYAEAAAKLGEQINEAGNKFGKSAIAYRNDEITIDEFQNKFDSFAPKVRDFIRYIEALSPPPEAESIHQKLSIGLSRCDKAIDLMNDWFDVPDTGTKEDIMLLVTSCIDQITSAEDELKELTAKN